MLQAIQKASMILILAAAVFACQNDKKVREAALNDVSGGVQPTEATAVPEPQSTQLPAGPITSIEFLAGDRHNFGKIKAGAKARHVFKFKNTGKEPLIIADAKASCGCTTPEWPKEPIKPGPRVKPTAFMSCFCIPACFKAISTTGTMLAWCALEATSGTTPP